MYGWHLGTMEFIYLNMALSVLLILALNPFQKHLNQIELLAFLKTPKVLSGLELFWVGCFHITQKQML